MASDTKPKARLPRGLVDRHGAELSATRAMLEKIRAVYELYGFEALETPAIEYTDALGKFLPDQDRPNEGVFSFQDDDEQWLSLRYDLTAPLARHVAEHFEKLPKPYRSYRSGYVFRNEKPGPGRFRQFMQFDADTVGAPSVAADAEICMMAADTLEAVGIARGDYVIKVNNRKVLDGVLEAIGLGGAENAGRRLTVLRAIDKLDRLGMAGVEALLGKGRKDESGDVTKGAELSPQEIIQISNLINSGVGDSEARSRLIAEALKAARLGADQVRALFSPSDDNPDPCLSSDQIKELFQHIHMFPGFRQPWLPLRRQPRGDDLFWNLKFEDENYKLMIDNFTTIEQLRRKGPNNAIFLEGVAELETIAQLADAAGYGSGRILIDPSVVRGLEYYTGPVYEAELTFQVKDEDGRPVRFGSVAGGGRYDGLVARFRGEPVPATGFSIGVSRLLHALAHLGKMDTDAEIGPVVVLAMDKEPARIADYMKMVSDLRRQGIRAEMYLGGAGMKAQMKYADRRGAPAVIIQGSNEKEAGEVQIKDLVEGAKIAASIADNAEYRAARPAQFAVKESELVDAIRGILERRAAPTLGLDD